MIKAFKKYWILTTLCVSGTALAQSLETLEVEALTQYNDFLPEIERETVQYLKVHPESAFAHYILSYLYLRRYVTDPQDKDYATKSLELAQQAIELEPKSEFGYLATSDAFQTLGFGDKAWEILKQSNSKSWRVLYRILKFQYEPVEPQKAILYMEPVLIKDPESRDVMIPLFLNFTKNFDLYESEHILERLDKHFHHPLIEQELALLDLSKKEFKKARQLFETIEHTDAYPEITMNFGYLLLTEFHDANAALLTLTNKSYLQSLPRSLISSNRMYLSLIYLEKHDFIHFKESAALALSSSSETLRTLDFLISGIVEKKYDLDAFVNFMNSNFPGHSEFFALFGDTYSEKLQDYVKAVDSYSKAIILDPSNTEYHDALGSVYFKMKDWKKALKAFDHALNLDPNDSLALYNKACIFSLRGEKKLALENLKNAIDLNPSFKQEALENLDFASLKNSARFQELIKSTEDTNPLNPNDPL